MHCPNCKYSPQQEARYNTRGETSYPLTTEEELDSFEVAGCESSCVLCPECYYEFEVPDYWKYGVMHYVIMKWDDDILRWLIVHYSHDYNDFQRMIILYPRESGYHHMVEIGYIKSHEVSEFFNALKPKGEKNANK